MEWLPISVDDGLAVHAPAGAVGEQAGLVHLQAEPEKLRGLLVAEPPHRVVAGRERRAGLNSENADRRGHRDGHPRAVHREPALLGRAEWRVHEPAVAGQPRLTEAGDRNAARRGLGHVDDPTQLMYGGINETLGLAAGDRAGLAKVGRAGFGLVGAGLSSVFPTLVAAAG